MPIARRLETAAARRSRLNPRLEALESRALMAASAALAGIQAAKRLADTAYVEKLIGARALATADGTALRNRTVADLAHGVSRQGVVLRILRSPAAANEEVRDVYVKVLGRSPSAAELKAGRQVLTLGGDSRTLIIRAVSSAEFLARNGGDQSKAIGVLYSILLSRKGSTAEIASHAASSAAKSGNLGAVARAIAFSPESTTHAASVILANSGAASPQAIHSAALALRSPGAVTRVEATALATDSAYATLTNPAAATGTPRLAAGNGQVKVRAAIENTQSGVPLAPGFNLRSSITNLPVLIDPFDNSFLALNLTSMGQDGSVWASDGHSMFVLPQAATTWTQVLSVLGGFSDLAATTSSTAWAITTGFVSHFVGGSWAIAPSLPGGDKPSAIAAGVDSFVNVLGASGQVYQLAGGGQSWNTLPSPGTSLTTIKASGTDVLIGIGAGNGAADRSLWTYSNGAWSQITGGPALTDAAVGADGAIWAWGQNSTTINVMLPDGTWTVPPTTNLLSTTLKQTIGYVMATSANLAVVVPNQGLYPFPQTVQFAYGLLDRPATTYPAFANNDQVTAYNAIGTALGITVPGGIRSQYPNLNFDPDLAALTVTQMTAPQGISQSDWQIVQTQVLKELSYIGPIQNLYQNFQNLGASLNSLSNTVFLTSINMVLGSTNSPQSNNTATLVVEALGEAVLGAIGAAGVGPAYSIAASLLSTTLVSAISALQGTNPPDANGAVYIVASNLGQTVANLFVTTSSQQGNDEIAILSNWSYLSAVGQQLTSGQWAWPANLTSGMLSAASPALELYFLQALIPAKYQIIGFEYGDYVKEPLSDNLNVPSYDIDTVYGGMHHGRPWEYVYFMNAQGASHNPFDGEDLSPFPTSAVFDTLFNDLGVNPDDFWAGNGGWAEIPYIFVKVD